MGAISEEEQSKPVGLPEAFRKKMERLLGPEYEAFVRSYETKRVQGLRFNTLKGNQQEFEEQCREQFGLTPVPWCREGFYYDAPARPGRHPYHEAGVYYIQEPSAMAVVSLLDPQLGERVLDLCAAPGGKTTHIAERLCGKGLLVSNEIHPARARILFQNVERMGIQNAVVTNEDSEKMLRFFPGFFDRIVVDAPCSGEGMFRKDEQARTEWSEQNVELCAVRQQEILDNAAGMLKPGGRLVYSTCTFSPEEDEDGIAAFLERHAEFSVVRSKTEDGFKDLSPGRPEWSDRECPELSFTYRIWPHKTEGEGHYLALLEKADEKMSAAQDGPEQSAGETGKKGKRKKNDAPSCWKDKDGRRILEKFLEDTIVPENMAAEGDFMENLVLFGEQIYRLPEGMPDFSGLRVLRPGLHLGTLKKNRLEPSHALALALRPDQVKRYVDFRVDGDEILSYLSGNTIPAKDQEKGWVLVCVDGYSIGWAKSVSGILKNHYPKGLRI